MVKDCVVDLFHYEAMLQYLRGVPAPLSTKIGPICRLTTGGPFTAGFWRCSVTSSSLLYNAPPKNYHADYLSLPMPL